MGYVSAERFIVFTVILFTRDRCLLNAHWIWSSPLAESRRIVYVGVERKRVTGASYQCLVIRIE
jgi:hypothetical protein